MSSTRRSTDTAEIRYPKDKEHLLLGAQKMAHENPAGFRFHYDPYDFDSAPGREFFVDLLKQINVQAAEVEDIYFTGALTDPAKTDYYVEYRGDDDRWHRYTPEFVIRKRPKTAEKAGTGRVLIVEIKSTQFEVATRDDIGRAERGEEPITAEGRKAVALRKLTGLNPDKLRYELVFAGTGVTYEKLAEARRFVQEPERAYEADLTTARRLKDLILKADARPVRKIILFGSRARGDARADSDFDLLVVVPGITPSEKRTYLVDLYAALRGAGVTAEPWVMDEQEFEESKQVIGGLAYPAWKEGVVLYDNP
jgi:predicted nucleotidyltransferase